MSAASPPRPPIPRRLVDDRAAGRRRGRPRRRSSRPRRRRSRSCRRATQPRRARQARSARPGRRSARDAGVDRRPHVDALPELDPVSHRIPLRWARKRGQRASRRPRFLCANHCVVGQHKGANEVTPNLACRSPLPRKIRDREGRPAPGIHRWSRTRMNGEMVSDRKLLHPRRAGQTVFARIMSHPGSGRISVAGAAIPDSTGPPPVLRGERGYFA